MQNRKRKAKNFIKNGLLILSLALAMILFVMSAVQLSISNPFGMISMTLTGGYIVLFCYVNEVEL